VSRAAENARRRAFRGEVQGQLPFDLMGMDNVINFAPTGGRDTGSSYTLERSDIKSMCLFLSSMGVPV
jgi:autophagy-related protein 11